MKFEGVISADSHVLEPPDLWSKAMESKYGVETPRMLHDGTSEQRHFFYAGTQLLDMTGHFAMQERLGANQTGHVPEARVAFQKETGVQAEVLIGTLMMNLMQSMRGEALRASASAYNDWLAEFTSYDPGRLIGVGMVPINDVAWAVREFERLASRGFKSMVINLVPPPGCPPLRDRAYDPLWARAEEMGLPIMLHSATGAIPNPLHVYSRKEREEAPGTLIQVMSEVVPALTNEFIFGAILDRFPGLKVISNEFELSWVPHYMWRLDQIQGDFSRRLSLPKLKMKASDYVRHRVWHGVINDPETRFAVERIGVDQIMWGSDYPHNIGIADAQQALARALEGFSAQDQAKVVGGTAASVYNLH